MQLTAPLPSPPADSADTTALPLDTLSLSDRLRADSTLRVLTDPTQIGDVFGRLREQLIDVNLWLGAAGTLLHIALVLILAWGVLRLVSRLTTRWQSRFEGMPAGHPRRQRAFTLGSLVMSTARYVVWPVAGITALGEIGIQVGPLLATAGIAGLAIGFGAQTLVKDVISGVFLLFDDTLHVGDLVRIGNDIGTVEYLGVRLIKVRRFDGELLMIPAGELRLFGNRSIGFTRVIVNVGLSYEQDIDTILPVLERVANAWAQDHPEALLDEKPTVQAIIEYGESAVTARVTMRVLPGANFDAETEIRLMLKREFDRLGIELPFPRRTVYLRQETTLPHRGIIEPAPDDPVQPEALGDA